MKKLISVFLSMSLVLAYVMPTYVSAEETVKNVDVEHVSFEEYQNNKDYYDSLITQGYAIGVSFDATYSDEQIQDLLNLPIPSGNSSDETIQPRGASQPTAVHNIHLHGSKEVHSDADYEIMWSNYKYTGCTFYLLQLFNYDYNNELRIRIFNTSDDTVDVSVNPRSGINYAFHTDSTSDEFYFFLSPPSHTDGYIFCCPAS